MCGIVGILTGTNNHYCLQEIVNNMAEKIVHRGPDNTGVYFDKKISFCCAHQRLSILDLSKAGNQPMISFHKRMVIAFNGEIYNFKELRKKLNLETKIIWEGNSDTEVLINAIEFWGLKKTLENAIGMFAFALLDNFQKKLYLVRDRFGEKPLYWGFAGSNSAKALVFGSEISAIKEFPCINKDIDLKALDAYLKFSCIPSDLTVYNSIKKLKPGHIAEFKIEKDLEINSPEIYKWWDYQEIVNSNKTKEYISKKEALTDLEETLKNATTSCLVSDVPVGCFLSGGIDSSLLTAIISKNSINKVNTFTIGFENQNYDESGDAKKIADFLGTNHEEVTLMPSEALRLIPNLPNIYSEPFADPSQIPTALISREIKKKGIDVALTGDGGDEMFGGYVRHFQGPRIWSKLKLIPYPLRERMGYLMNYLPISKLEKIKLINQKYNFSEKIYKVSRKLETIKSEDELYRCLLTINQDNTIYSDSLKYEVRESLLDHNDEFNQYPNSLNDDPIARMLYWDALTYLPDDILVKVDRASMAFSLETRAPFLDKRVSEIAWRIPTKMKVNNGQGKIILKELLCKYLPKEFVYRPKKGFGVPIKEWLRGPLKDWAEELLKGNQIKNQNLFSLKKIDHLWDDHINQKTDNTSILWSILMWQSWLNNNK